MPKNSNRLRICSCSFCGAVILASWSTAIFAANLGVVPFWDGETTQFNPLLNRYGGSIVTHNVSAQPTISTVHSGHTAYQINSAVAQGGFGFLQNLLSPSGANVVSRDISRFDEASFWLNNTTGSPFTLKYELKDYRDSGSHAAVRFFNIPAAPGWQQFTAPLNLSDPGWSVQGSPDLERARFISYVIEANQGQAVNGQIYFDDVSFVEPGGPVDSQTANLNDLVDRLAHRQFDALWGSRNRNNALVPLHNTNADSGALNVTSALLKALPGAVNRGWVTQPNADNYVQTLVNTLDSAMNQTTFLPSR